MVWVCYGEQVLGEVILVMVPVTVVTRMKHQRFDVLPQSLDGICVHTTDWVLEMLAVVYSAVLILQITEVPVHFLLIAVIMDLVLYI